MTYHQHFLGGLSSALLTQMCDEQALEAARARADGASAAAATARKALDALELRIPKARLEADAQRARAADLASRLDRLRADARVCPRLALTGSCHTPARMLRRPSSTGARLKCPKHFKHKRSAPLSVSASSSSCTRSCPCRAGAYRAASSAHDALIQLYQLQVAACAR